MSFLYIFPEILYTHTHTSTFFTQTIAYQIDSFAPRFSPYCILKIISYRTSWFIFITSCCSTVCTYHNFLTQSLINGPLAYFQSFAITYTCTCYHLLEKFLDIEISEKYVRWQFWYVLPNCSPWKWINLYFCQQQMRIPVSSHLCQVRGIRVFYFCQSGNVLLTLMGSPEMSFSFI